MGSNDTSWLDYLRGLGKVEKRQQPLIMDQVEPKNLPERRDARGHLMREPAMAEFGELQNRFEAAIRTYMEESGRNPGFERTYRGQQLFQEIHAMRRTMESTRDLMTRQDILRRAEQMFTSNAQAMASAWGVVGQATTTAGAAMPAATSRPDVSNRPGTTTAPRCPVHRVRMTYKPADGAWKCVQRDQTGNECTCVAHHKAKDLTLLRNHKYSGPVKVLASQVVDNGQEYTHIYLMLTDIGMVVDITGQIDVEDVEGSGKDPIIVSSKDSGCTVRLRFDSIEYAQGTP